MALRAFMRPSSLEAQRELGVQGVVVARLPVALLDTGRSWGPGVFGGSLVDADVRRNDDRYPTGKGRDRFAEIFPMANLLVPAPLGTQVSVLHDGRDGKQAAIRVEGAGHAMIHVLYAIKKFKSTIELLQFKDLKPDVWFRTDYILEPGKSYVRMKTTVRIAASPDPNKTSTVTCDKEADCGDPKLTCVGVTAKASGKCACKPMDDCAVKCESGQGGQLSYAIDVSTGCHLCPADKSGCSKTLAMDNVTGSEGVISTIMGDSPIMKQADPLYSGDNYQGGVGAGDFVFFGKYNKQFVPGNGFDQQKAVWDAWFEGRDTFAKPFMFDWVAAVGGDVSYAYYNVADAEKAGQKVAVPVFTSTATPFISATKRCEKDTKDDADCDAARLFTYERFLAVGDGDVSSVAAIIAEHRGEAMGTVKGYVRWRDTGNAAHDAHIVVFKDPAPGTDWQDRGLKELIKANRAKFGSPGAINAIDADRGTDITLDGDFEARLPAGDYVFMALDKGRVVNGDLIAAKVEADKTRILMPSLPTPARIRIRTADASGQRLPAKATVQLVDDAGKPVDYEGGKQVLLGHSRVGTGVHKIEVSADGSFDIPVKPGRYRVLVSHGIEYGVHDEKGADGKGFELAAAEVRTISAVLVPEIDTTGWASGDFHLHQRPSFDSGMPLDQRVRTIAAEGVDYVASTDHDVVTDFAPYIFAASLQRWFKSTIGVEISTLDMGHFIGFPIQYSELKVPDHGTPDWYCMTSNQLMDKVINRGGFTGANKGEKPTTIIAHPRDGFLGWADQMGLDPFSLTRKTPSLEDDNQIFRTVTCDHDAMEVFNAKRFDLIRTPTVFEIQSFERCMSRIEYTGRVNKKGDFSAAKMKTDLAGPICPELVDEAGNLFAGVSCPDGEAVSDCKMRYRRIVAKHFNNRILTRTPAEQKAWWNAKTDPDPLKAVALSDDRNKLCAIKLARNSETKVEEPDPAALALPIAKVVDPADYDAPCPSRSGVLDDYFRFLEYGLVKAAIGGSDSHDGHLEPGMPRNYIRSSTDDPSSINPVEMSKNLRESKVIATYGPFVDVSIDGKGPGETVKGAAGSKAVKIKVQTTSWFGIDRLEVYVNGLLAKTLGTKDGISDDVKALVDFDGTVTVDIPARDSWVVVVAMGLGSKHEMAPVYLDIPFGELQLPKLASMAFGRIPLASTYFPRPISYPDFYPVRPYAIANAILIDVDGNGAYDAPHKRAPFCSPACDPATGKLTADGTLTCKDIQSTYTCLAHEKRCGLDIPGTCDIYEAISGKALNGGHKRTAP